MYHETIQEATNIYLETTLSGRLPLQFGEHR